MNSENQLDYQKEEIGPRPHTLGILEPELQIEYLECADEASEADKDP